MEPSEKDSQSIAERSAENVPTEGSNGEPEAVSEGVPRWNVWRFSVDFYNQWPELGKIQKWNWINFDFVRLAVEVSPYKKSWEVEVGLLGLIAIVTYWHKWWFRDKGKDAHERFDA